MPPAKPSVKPTYEEPTPTEPESETKTGLKIIGYLAISVLLLALLRGCYKYIKRQNRKSDEVDFETLLDGGAVGSNRTATKNESSVASGEDLLC